MYFNENFSASDDGGRVDGCEFSDGRDWIIPLQSLSGLGDSPQQFMLLLNSYFPIRRVLVLCALLVCYGNVFGEEEKGEVEAEVAEKVEEESGEPKADERDETSEVEGDDGEVASEKEEAAAPAVARPVAADPVQLYGWREKILLDGYKQKIDAKLDTGAFTSSIHAEEKELFERDGKKWVRFIVTEPSKEDSPRVRIEAPLTRIARIKEPGGESETREVVRLAFKIGDRKLRGDFTLNDRSNMLAAVLIGRTTIKELGWVDPSRTNLAKKKIMR